MKPEIGQRVRATTTTKTEQSVVIEVASIDCKCGDGYQVYGYRVGNRRKGVRGSAVPRLYFVRTGGAK